MKRLIKFTAAASLSLMIVACGKTKADSDSNEPISEVPMEQTDAITEALMSHDRKQLNSIIDEMALNADDLSASQAVTVLMGYYELHLQYSSEGKYKSDLETMRNFVDVYDIVSSNHGNEFKSKLSDTRSLYPDVDFNEMYVKFAEKLSDYIGGVSNSPAKPDSITPDTLKSVSDSLPPELRPAL